MKGMESMFGLDGCTAIVTGASGWLGTAMTGALAEAGAHVVAVARDKGRLDALVEPLRAAGLSVEAAPCDITTDAWPELIRRVVAEHGRIDVLLNNAHIGRGGSLRQATADDYREALDLAVVAAAPGSRPAGTASPAVSTPAAGRRSSTWLSMYGVVSPDPGMYDTEAGTNPPYYGVAKAGLLQLTRYAAAELGPAGIRVNAITPGPFPQHPERMDPAFTERLAGAHRAEALRHAGRHQGRGAVPGRTWRRFRHRRQPRRRRRLDHHLSQRAARNAGATEVAAPDMPPEDAGADPAPARPTKPPLTRNT